MLRRESLTYLTCNADDISQTAAQVVTTSALSLYSSTFLRWYMSYDRPLKRCLKKTFLLPLLTCVFLSCPAFADLSKPSWPVWLCCLRCECCFDSKQHRLYPRPPCLILLPKTFIDLCFVFKQLASWTGNLRWNLNKLKLVAGYKPPPKSAVKRDTSMHKLKTCDDLCFRLIRAFDWLEIDLSQKRSECERSKANWDRSSVNTFSKRMS